MPTANIVKNDFKSHKVTFNNPVETHLNLTIPGQNEMEMAIVHLYNSEGKLVYGNTLNSKSSLDVSHLVKGVYLMRVSNGNIISNHKVLKL